MIWCVEDDASIRDIVLYALDSAGFESRGFEDGLTFWNALKSEKPDLILLDVMLPHFDGFEICKEVRRYSDVPIMFITARCGQEDILNGYALGCDDYIVKPFSLPVFYNKVLALIKRSKGLVRSSVLSAGNLSLNPNKGIVVSDGEEK